ncbi:hypothetical protein [Streptomyces sp. TS71-3]|uniref:hypothetical protein n=1 Tax=Streptomyces sp. TS71-3 TaxID=2733862 RepID=UPI001B08C777|nr:hypothetical protein [Streptomyces sp. TS71-3]GHJ38604.1 hypothetical protein Sm713_42130 [Streptomyces sp. TS71-3]
MPRMLDVSDDVRAEIGDEEADRLLAGENAPGSYDCTSCRTPGDPGRQRTSTVLFVGDETAVLAFAHAACLPSQVVQVTEEQLRGAVRSIAAEDAPAPGSEPMVPDYGVPAQEAPGLSVPGHGGMPGYESLGGPEGLPGQAPPAQAVPGEEAPEYVAPGHVPPGQAVLGVTSGLVLVAGELHPALVVEPTGPITRAGFPGGDDFLPLLIEQGFMPVGSVDRIPPLRPGWSVLLSMGQLHAVLQPGHDGVPVAWWQAHQPLQVTDGWRIAAAERQQVLVFAAPVGSIGRQPREDLLREALDRAAAHGLLVASAMPLSGT